MDTQEALQLLAGAEHAENGRPHEAEEAFAAAVLQDPALHMARFQLGLLQWSMARAGAAAVTWQPLSEMPAGADLGHFARAFGLWWGSDLRGASAEFRLGLACCANLPLAGDMQKMHAAVAQQLEEKRAAEPVTHHVLLANYVTAGQAH
jgi:hypothetical protein